MSIYKTVINESGTEFIVRNNEDGSISWIPKDESNSDYQKYLEDTKDTWTEPVLTK